MFLADWLYRIIKFCYYLKDQEFTQCDLVVPLGYALLPQKELPDAEEKILGEAARIALEYQTPIAWVSADYLWPGCDEEENRLKINELRSAGVTIAPIIGEGVIDTVTEAQSIKKVVAEAGLQPRTIVVVTDWPHARRARRIWKKAFPESTIIMRSVEGKWDKSHPNFSARSNMRWLLANIAYHFLFIVVREKGTVLLAGLLRRKDNKKGV